MRPEVIPLREPDAFATLHGIMDGWPDNWLEVEESRPDDPDWVEFVRVAARRDKAARIVEGAR